MKKFIHIHFLFIILLGGGLLLSSMNSAYLKAKSCGNGVVEAKEECDDGNTKSNDGCSKKCRIEICGDKVKQIGEECDDGNSEDGDGCNSKCKVEMCGNKRVDPQEECDDGNKVEKDGCDNNCQIELDTNDTSEEYLDARCLSCSIDEYLEDRKTLKSQLNSLSKSEKALQKEFHKNNHSSTPMKNALKSTTQHINRLADEIEKLSKNEHVIIQCLEKKLQAVLNDLCPNKDAKKVYSDFKKLYGYFEQEMNLYKRLIITQIQVMSIHNIKIETAQVSIPQNIQKLLATTKIRTKLLKNIQNIIKNLKNRD